MTNEIQFDVTLDGVELAVTADVHPGYAGDSGMGRGGRVRNPSPPEDPEVEITCVEVGGTDILPLLSREQIKALAEQAIEEVEA